MLIKIGYGSSIQWVFYQDAAAVGTVGWQPISGAKWKINGTEVKHFIQISYNTPKAL